MKTLEKVRDEICYGDEERTLFNAVIEQIGTDWEEIWNYPQNFRNASNGVSGFIYYSETHKFAKENIEEILYVLNEFEEEIGEPLQKDGDKLNWLAWFALEIIIDKIMMYKEDEDEDEDEEEEEEEE